jgi:LCP family protein required for cell wall assembly
MSTWRGSAPKRDARLRAAPRNRRGHALARALAITGIVVIALVFISGVALYVVLNGLTNPVHFDSLAKTVPGARVNILVMGLDAPLDSHYHAQPNFDIHTASGSRTDTMMLFSVDPKTSEVGILSLPRDTRTIIVGREDYGYDKLGHAHAYGGPDMTVATVSNLLSVPIHYYVRVNSDGVAKIIDRLGGVEIYVEHDMHYHDPYQDLNIDLQQGLQVLNGEQAAQYMRYRSDGNDITRIERQQKLITALKEQVFSLGTITRIPSLIGEISDAVDTNLTAGEMLTYARMAAKLSDVVIKTGFLPGENTTITDPGREMLWYWLPDFDEAAPIIDEILWGVDSRVNSSITIEVQNGTSVADLGSRFADELRRQGYNVVAVVDADRPDYQETEVIDRSRDEDKLRRLSQAVLRYVPDANLGRARPQAERPEFTIILGQDYATLVATESGYGGRP